MNTIRLRYDVTGGPQTHPQTVMGELARERGWKIMSAEPEPIGDCWFFTIEIDLPNYIQVAEPLPVPRMRSR